MNNFVTWIKNRASERSSIYGVFSVIVAFKILDLTPEQATALKDLAIALLCSGAASIATPEKGNEN